MNDKRTTNRQTDRPTRRQLLAGGDLFRGPLGPHLLSFIHPRTEILLLLLLLLWSSSEPINQQIILRRECVFNSAHTDTQAELLSYLLLWSSIVAAAAGEEVVVWRHKMETYDDDDETNIHLECVYFHGGREM